jgi:hypothetical protein
MPQWSGTAVPIGRMLGQVDQDDPTNLPLGCASTCKNTDFTRDSTGSALDATTRAGNCLIIQGSQKSPGTGFIDFQYEPEFAGDPFFQQMLLFSMTGTLERESPVGSGRMIPVPAGMYVPPANSHKIDAQTANLVFSAYSSAEFAQGAPPLQSPSAGCSCYNPKTLNYDPLGMKPFGFNWTPATYVYAGEVVTPSTSNSGLQGNGHTYQAQNSGWTALTAADEPQWPLVEGIKGGMVTEDPVGAGKVAVAWKELTMVIANRIPSPDKPALALASGGIFAAGRTIYILLTMTNGMGETIGGVTASITTTAANQGVQVTIPTLASLAGWLSQLVAPYAIVGANIYEADVAAGAEPPPQSEFQLVAGGPFALGTTPVVTGTAASAIYVPAINSARITPGQLPAPISEPVISRSPAGSVVLPPAAPGLSLVNGGGTFASGRTVWVGLTLLNSNGETTIGGIASITTTQAGQGVQVSIANSYGATVTGVNIYESDYPSGHTPGPYQLWGSAALGSTPIITASGSGVQPPDNNTATLPVGAFPGGRDIWVRLSYSNALGETPLGPSNSIINTLPDDAVEVTLSSVPNYPQITIINVYETDVPTGDPEPPISAYAKVGAYDVTAILFITQPAAGQPPVTVNGTGPGGNVPADTEDGGINGTQGYRYAVPAWMNRNETISGFTQAAVSSYIVDEDGWEIAVFNVATGPPNIIARLVNWTVADGTQAGPFAWIGKVVPNTPSQNQVYPNSYQSDSITIMPTIFLDNVTTKGTFNFTDEYLTGLIQAGAGGNNTTDRLTLMPPPQAVRVDFLKTANRLCLSGVPGCTTGHVISLAADYESFDASTSELPIRTDSGEIAWGVLEYRNQIYSMRERSGVVLTPGSGQPVDWNATPRWSSVGPCGPRAFAQNGQFIGFVHRTGFYKFDATTPDMMSKEIPREWGTINWAAATTISVTIDDDTHTVRIQAPVGNSKIPNKEFCLSYLEGWENPLHFTAFMQKEITMEAARRWSFNDFSAYICKRIYRNVANPPPLSLGANGSDQLGSDFYISQLAYTTTDGSGLVNARTPGRFDDNGGGIDWVYETTSAKAMQKPCKPEGVVTACVGYGPINVSFIAGRRRITDNRGPSHVLKCQPMILDPEGGVDYTRKPDRATDEYWRVRYDNGKAPGVWASLKSAQVYLIPVKMARGSMDGGK